MKFTKMQGIGNDYIYINCFEETVTDPCKLSKRISDRHFGIGSDGLILILPSDVADFKMDMYNSDGSQGKMCGNGIRCVGKYVYDNKMTNKTNITIETLSGIKNLELFGDGKEIKMVKVDMGKPILKPYLIPVNINGEKAINQPIEVDGKIYRMTCVSMGNPHAVVFVDDVDLIDIEKIGPLFEHHPLFPDMVNTEFVEPIDKNTIKMRVWERGAGETLACGTGACAAAVASILNKKCSGEGQVTVKLRGGDLYILWDRKNDEVFMTGPAERVFDGNIAI